MNLFFLTGHNNQMFKDNNKISLIKPTTNSSFQHRQSRILPKRIYISLILRLKPNDYNSENTFRKQKILAYKRDYGINQQMGFLKIW